MFWQSQFAEFSCHLKNIKSRCWFNFAWTFVLQKAVFKKGAAFDNSGPNANLLFGFA